MTDFNKELCDEKHRNLEELVKTIKTAILNEDPSILTKVSGIGKIDKCVIVNFTR